MIQLGSDPFGTFLQDLQRFGAAIMTFYLCGEIGDALVVQRIGQRSTKPPIEVRISLLQQNIARVVKWLTYRSAKPTFGSSNLPPSSIIWIVLLRALNLHPQNINGYGTIDYLLYLLAWHI